MKGFTFWVDRGYEVGEVIKRRSRKWKVVPDERWIVTSVADVVNWGLIKEEEKAGRGYEEKVVKAAQAVSDKYMSVIKEGSGEEGTAVYVPYKKK